MLRATKWQMKVLNTSTWSADSTDNYLYHVPTSFPALPIWELLFFISLIFTLLHLSLLRCSRIPLELLRVTVCSRQRLYTLSRYIHTPHSPRQACTSGEPALPVPTCNITLSFHGYALISVLRHHLLISPIWSHFRITTYHHYLIINDIIISRHSDTQPRC